MVPCFAIVAAGGSAISGTRFGLAAVLAGPLVTAVTSAKLAPTFACMATGGSLTKPSAGGGFATETVLGSAAEAFSCSAVVTEGGSAAVAAGCTVLVTGVSVVPAAAAAAEAVAVIAGQGLGGILAG